MTKTTPPAANDYRRERYTAQGDGPRRPIASMHASLLRFMLVGLLASPLWLACEADPDSQADVSPGDTSESPDLAVVDAATGDDDTVGAIDDDAQMADTVATDDAGNAEDADATVQAPTPPTDDAAALEAWLAAGHYTDWPAEAAPHDSSGPHFGTVRTFLNTTLDASLATGNTEHPSGSVAVKELYGMGASVRGYSVTVKLAEESDAGANWYWYERYDDSVYADGTGVGLCTGCHSGGDDFVLIPHPF